MIGLESESRRVRLRDGFKLWDGGTAYLGLVCVGGGLSSPLEMYVEVGGAIANGKSIGWDETESIQVSMARRRDSDGADAYCSIS